MPCGTRELGARLVSREKGSDIDRRIERASGRRVREVQGARGVHDLALLPPGEAIGPAGDGPRRVNGAAPGRQLQEGTGEMFERVEIRGVLLLRAARVEDTRDRVPRKRRGASGRKPRRPLSNASSGRPGERRDRSPEDERLGKGNLERAEAASEAAFAAEEVAGTGAGLGLPPLGICSANAPFQSID